MNIHPDWFWVAGLIALGLWLGLRLSSDSWAAEALTGPKEKAAEELLARFGLSMYVWSPAEAAPYQLRFGVRRPEDVNRIARTGMRPWPFYRALRRISEDPSGPEAAKLELACARIERRAERREQRRRAL